MRWVATGPMIRISEWKHLLIDFTPRRSLLIEALVNLLER